MRARRSFARNLPMLFVAGGIVLLLAAVFVALLTRWQRRGAARVPTGASVESTRSRSTTAAAAPTTGAAPAATVPAAPTVAPFSWQAAGGLVWHAEDVDPTVLGRQVRAAGFGWIAVQLADGEHVTAPSPTWISLFRAASGLPVGGWSVLREQPAVEARLSASLVSQDQLSFYIADAEQEYAKTNGSDVSAVRYDRSRAFVTAFRAAEPLLPAGLSSYCRPDKNDLDWGAWASADFVFLPQAYVSTMGPDGEPATCVSAAAPWFPKQRVHPTLGIFGGPEPTPSPVQYAQLLAAAGTVGFSLFPAETAGDEWQAFGNEIQTLHVARPPA